MQKLLRWIIRHPYFREIPRSCISDFGMKQERWMDRLIGLALVLINYA